jgi:glycine/serine hydroxymethyltransferase
MKIKEIKKIAAWINEACDNIENKKEIKKIHREVKALCKKFPLYK